MSDAENQSTRRATSVEDAKRKLQASREALMHQMVPSTRPRRAASLPGPTSPGYRGRPGVPPLGIHTAAGQRATQDDATKNAAPFLGAGDARPVPRRTTTRSRAQKSSTFAVVRHAFNAWWQFHPARAVTAIAEPFVEEFAERRPFRLLAISLVAGATFAIVRPWRLVSVGGIALAALKSSRVSSAALNFLADKARRN